MGYTLVYTQVLEFLPYLIKGAWISLQIAILAFFGGMFFGLILATIRTFGNNISNRIVFYRESEYQSINNVKIRESIESPYILKTFGFINVKGHGRFSIMEYLDEKWETLKEFNKRYSL